MLLKAHSHLGKRHAKRTNELNHSAAFTAAISQTKEGDKIDPTPWLPYKIGEHDKRLTPELCRVTIDLAKKGNLPIPMMASLELSGILPKMRELIDD